MPNQKTSPVDIPIAEKFLQTKQLVMTIGDSGYSVSAIKDTVIAAMLHPSKNSKTVDMSQYTSSIEAHMNQRANIGKTKTVDGTPVSITHAGRKTDIAVFDENFSNMVRDYQRTHHITPITGNIGNATKQALAEDLARLQAEHLIHNQATQKIFTRDPEYLTNYISKVPKDSQDAYRKELEQFNAQIKAQVNITSVLSIGMPSLAAHGISFAPDYGAATTAQAPASNRKLGV